MSGAMGVLQGKVVVITGAGSGIGRAAALLAAQEGARVVVNDLGVHRDGTPGAGPLAREVVDGIRVAGGDAVADEHSVATREGVRALVEAALGAYGRLDAWIHSAGIVRDQSLLKADDAGWDAVLDVHLRGTFLSTQAAAQQMISQGGGGHIVHTTSVAGLLGNFGQASYAAAEAGVYGLTRTAAIELQKRRITVNALAPLAKTRMTVDLPMFQGVSTLTPEHVAPAAIFLASDLVGDRTGHLLAVAGARVYAYKIVESDGRLKEDGAPWTPAELARHWDSITKFSRG